ncbi:MAG TPA: hypothetical protein DGB32_00605, partial [Dehalococcoidia bacterium]|nr:hypothetical protein [Dehalococcoidia bacterium]
LEPSAGGAIEAGLEIEVGTIEVWVGEYPHPVAPSALTVLVTGPTGESVTGSLRMVDALDDGTAWKFEVFVTPSETGRQAVTAELNVEYVGRTFITSGPTAQTSVTVNYPVVLFDEIADETANETADGSMLPVIGGVMISLLIMLGVVVFVINRRHVMPYGYIYDDRQQLILDLSMVRRGGLKGLTSRGVVSLADAPELPVPGATMVFKRSGVELRYENSGNFTMRVDGQPAPRVTELRDGSRIGYSGRLFEYTTTRRHARRIAPVPTASPEPAAG